MQNPPPYQQQYGAPPQDTGKGPLGLDPKVFAMLCYAPCCIGLVFSIIGVAMEKTNRLIRFHAFQGLFYVILTIVVSIVVNIVFTILARIAGGFIAYLTYPIGLVFLGIAIYMMIKAYGGEFTKLPVIGDLAEKQAG